MIRRILSALRDTHTRTQLHAAAAGAVVLWGVGVLQTIATELQNDADEAEARLARLLEAEEDHHERAAAAADAVTDEVGDVDDGVPFPRPLGQVVPAQRDVPHEP